MLTENRSFHGFSSMSLLAVVHSIKNMGGNELDPEENDAVESCIFCLIASGQDLDAEVLKQHGLFNVYSILCLPSADGAPVFHSDEELVCFRDIAPAAPHHYLVVPRQHIHSCMSLHKGHINLVKKMAEMGKAVLRDQGITDMDDIRLGFHQPPFISVNHLHLHVLAPISKISGYMEYKFIPGSARFLTEESLQKRLKKSAPPLKYYFSLCQLAPKPD